MPWLEGVQKFGNGGFMVAGSHRNAVYVTPREDGSFDVQAGVGLCRVSRKDLLAIGRAAVEVATTCRGLGKCQVNGCDGMGRCVEGVKVQRSE